MAAVREDEESLLASDRESENIPHGFGKTARWHGRNRSLFQHRGIRIGVLTIMILAVFVVAATALRMLYVYHAESD